MKAKKQKSLSFHLFRYQLLPTSQTLQMSFEPMVSSMEDLRKKKNEFFAKCLQGIKEYEYPRTKLTHLFHDLGEGLYALRLGARRRLNRYTKNFTEEEIENWPSVWIFINNDPDVQKMAIQSDRKVFVDTATVAKLVEDAVNTRLSRYQLSACVEKIFEKKIFWELVNRFTNKIVQADFELISPNLANISKNLSFDLSSIHKTTNTQKTHLQLNSDKDASLTLSKDDPLVDGLVEYSSQGGGEITLKIRGYNRKIKTAKGIKEISIEEAQLSAKNPSDIKEIIKGIIGD